MQKISSFRGCYHFLSNFYQHPIEYKGLTYPNAEAAFQAQKCENEDEKVKYTLIKNPVAAKRMGKNEPNLPADWDKLSIEIMKDILKAKFSVPELAEMLIATGDDYLEEGNRWHDNKWGHCMCKKCQNLKAQNLLGNILMDIRREISEGSMDNLKIDRLDTGTFFVISWSTDKCHGELLINNPYDGPYETPEIHISCANFLQNFTEEESRRMTDSILKLLPEYIAKNGLFEPMYGHDEE